MAIEGEWPARIRVSGVSRNAADRKSLIVYFDRDPSCDEMLAMFDFLRAQNGTCGPVALPHFNSNSRIGAPPKSLICYFRQEPTDGEMIRVHDLLRGFHFGKAALH